MANTRCHLRFNTRKLNALISGAKAYLFVAGTGVVGPGNAPPTGTDVTMYNAASGGATVTNPRTASADQAEVEVWVDEPGSYDMILYDNGGIGLINVETGLAVTGFTQVKESVEAMPVKKARWWNTKFRPRILWMDPVDGLDPGDSGFDLDVAGREDVPYRTFQPSIDAVLDQGWEIRIKTTGQSSTPHITLASKVNISQKKNLKVIGPGASGMGILNGPCYIRGTIANDALFELTNSDFVEFRNIGPIENLGSNGIGMLVGENAAKGLFEHLVFVNCPGAGLKFIGNQVGQTLIDRVSARACGKGISFEDSPGGVAPNQMHVRGGRVEACTIAGYYIGTSNPTIGCNGIHLEGTGGGGAETIVFIEGGYGVSIDGECYWEPGGTNKPAIKIRGCVGSYTGEGDDGTNEAYWASCIFIRGINLIGLGSLAGWDAGRAVGLDINGAMRVHIDYLKHEGGAAEYNATNPIYHLRPRTKGCKINIDRVGQNQRNALETDWSKIMLDEGIGNGGDWFNPSTNQWENWGNVPSGSQTSAAKAGRKGADQSVTSSTVLVNATDMKFAALANEKWLVEFNAYVDGAQAGDIKFAITVPAGASVLWAGAPGLVQGITSSSGDAETKVQAGSGNPASFGVDTVKTLIHIEATVRMAATAGDVQLQFAQATSNATPTTMYQDSSWKATKVTQ